MADYIPIAVPATPADARDKNAELTEEHEKKRQEVLAHFDKDDYRIAGLPAEEKAELMDEEKMWLVGCNSRMDRKICSNPYVTLV